MKAQGLTALGFVLPVQASRASISTHLSAFIRSGVPPRWGPSGGLQRGSKYVLTHRTQGLRPGLCRSIAPLGAHCPTATINPPNNPSPQPIQSKSNKYTNERNNPFYTPQTHLTNTIPRHNTANAQSDNEP